MLKLLHVQEAQKVGYDFKQCEDSPDLGYSLHECLCGLPRKNGNAVVEAQPHSGIFIAIRGCLIIDHFDFIRDHELLLHVLLLYPHDVLSVLILDEWNSELI